MIEVDMIGPGDVLCTREGPRPVSGAIRLGAWLLRLPAGWNHVIVVHHHDPATGTWWGLEGRPGGVGWRDLSGVLASPFTIGNTAQPKTQTQRFLVATAAEKMLHSRYDWPAIASDARESARVNHFHTLPEWLDGETPAEVVCSSYADVLYEHPMVRLANPGGLAVTRSTQPAHWARFILDKEWERA